MNDRLRTIELLPAVTWPIVRRYTEADCCIWASRIGMDVLKHFGIKARCITVNFYCANAAFMEQMMKHGRMPRDKAELEEWHKENGATNMGVVSDDDDAKNWDRYNGHVVTFLPDDNIIIDLSSEQFNRPQYGITVEPAPRKVPVGWELLESEEAHYDLPGGGVAVYKARPDQRGYIFTQAWVDSPGRRMVVPETIAKLELELDH